MRETDLLIVGGGLAGLRAAELAEGMGISYLLVESDRGVGGALRYPLGQRGYVFKPPKHTIMESTVISLSRGLCRVVNAKGLSEVRFRAALLATGSRDINWAELYISGYRPAGVFTSTMAWRFMEMGYLPGRRVVVLGHLEAASFMAEDLVRLGVETIIVAPFDVEAPRGVHVYKGYTVSRIIGKRRVEGVLITPSKSYRAPRNGKGVFLKADALILSVGFKPHIPIREFGVPSLMPSFKSGIFQAGGAAAPFKTVDGVLGSVDALFPQIVKYLEGHIDTMPKRVRWGSGINFVFPQWLIGEPPYTLVVSLSSKGGRVVDQEGNEFIIKGWEGVVKLREAVRKDEVRLQVV